MVHSAGFGIGFGLAKKRNECPRRRGVGTAPVFESTPFLVVLRGNQKWKTEATLGSLSPKDTPKIAQDLRTPRNLRRGAYKGRALGKGSLPGVARGKRRLRTQPEKKRTEPQLAAKTVSPCQGAIKNI